jgi:hypothetical protein
MPSTKLSTRRPVKARKPFLRSQALSAKTDESGDEAKEEKSRGHRFFDKPVARVTAIIAAITGVITLAAIWPDTLWPRNVPALDVLITSGVDDSVIFGTSREAREIDSINPPIPSGDSCYSQQRLDWIRNVGGVPDFSQDIRLVAAARRKDTTVVLTDIKAQARKLPGNFSTGIVPCPHELGSGGNPASRYIGITLQDHPEVTIKDLDADKELKTLDLTLTNGEAAEFTMVASPEHAGEAYEWWAELSFLVDGKVETKRIPADGTFRVATTTDKRALWSDRGEPRICGPEALSKAASDGHEWCGTIH